MNLAAKITVIILGTDELDISRTMDSIRAQAVVSEADILVAPPHDTEPWSKTSDGVVLLLRAGDRMYEGGAIALLSGLHDADVVLGGYRIAGSGHWGLDVSPPKIDGIADLAKWAIAPPFELSAIGVRRGALASSVHPAPCLPGGELALLHAALTSTPNPTVRSINDTVCEVRIRPVHSGDTAAMLDQLRGTLAGPLGDEPITASRVRRRALSLAYLESGPPIAGQFDADMWWGPALLDSGEGSAVAIIRDLHWVLSCLAQGRRMAELGLDGLANTEPSDVMAELPPDFAGSQATNESLHVLVGELTDTTAWLHEEVRNRDERLAGAESLHQLINELSGTVAWLHEEVRLRDEQIAQQRSAE